MRKKCPGIYGKEGLGLLTVCRSDCWMWRVERVDQ